MKKIICAILSVVLLALNTIEVMADEPLYVYLGEYQAAENVLSLQVGNNIENSTDSISYRVTLGNEELEILNTKSYEEAELSASYIFLIDVSGSIKKAEMANIKSTLTLMVENMAEGDNASFMLVGDSAYTDEFLTDKNAMLEKINSIEVLREDTNLYYAINQALDILATSENCNERKCLVILSDGQDDQIAGITESEVKDKIEEVNVPICSIAMSRDNAGEDTTKIVGSFARMSPGGRHFIYGLDGGDEQEIASGVKNVVENIVILNTDISQYQTNDTESYLQVEMTADGIGTATDGYNVKSVALSNAIIPVETEEETLPIGFIVAAVVGVVVLIIVILLGKKKKKKALTAEENQESEETAEELAEESTVEGTTPTEMPLSVAVDLAKTEPVAKKELSPTIKVTLTRVGNIEEEIREVEICGELTIGRKPEKADLAFANDVQLSSLHCKLSYDGKEVRIEDLGSLNGTLVNGVPIKQIYTLKKDDKFYIGSMEWRITW